MKKAVLKLVALIYTLFDELDELGENTSYHRTQMEAIENEL